MGSIPFALQLYTVRDHIEKDLARTLKSVKEIGYDFVELAGFGQETAAEFKFLLDDVGLKAVSTHAGYDELRQNARGLVETCETMGVRFVALSCNADDKAGWIEIARDLDRCGAALREAGIRLCYHNHAHEFRKYEGQSAHEILMASARAENLACQLDTYWVQYGGEDPVALIDQYGGRCPLLHVKDMVADESRAFAEVGSGILDWPAIFAAGKRAGVEWYIVEQDVCGVDCLESAGISARFMARQ